ncbi:hypothetical protein BDV12DRAFT_189515 [Aspergillus spectabilis]
MGSCNKVVIHGDILKSHSTPWLDANSYSFANDEFLIIMDTDQDRFSPVCHDSPPPDLTSGNCNHTEEYTEALLTHARLHDFAAKYQLQECVTSAYSSCCISCMFSTIQPKKNLLHYAARYIRLFLHNRKFQILLQEQSALANRLLDTLGNGL